MTSGSVPTITRPDVALVLVGEWTLDVPARQRAAADAALAAWASVPWPGGLLSHACLLETDGEAVLHYMQWASEHACRGFVATDRADWARAVDTEVPGASVIFAAAAPTRRVAGRRVRRRGPARRGLQRVRIAVVNPEQPGGERIHKDLVPEWRLLGPPSRSARPATEGPDEVERFVLVRPSVPPATIAWL